MTTSPADRFDPTSATMATDRFALLAELRAVSPVQYVPSIGLWAVTGYDALKEVLGDPERFPSGLGYRAPDHVPAEAFDVYPADGPIWKYPLIGTDKELHRRLRAPLLAAFKPERIRALEPVIVADAADLLDDLFSDGEPADLYAKVVRPLPSRTIARLFGLPVEEAPRFAGYSSAFVTLQLPGLPAEAYIEASRQFAEFDAYVREIVTGDLAQIGEGVIRTFVEGARTGAHDLDEDEMVGDIANVLFAGHETTVSTLSNIFARLLSDRPLWSELSEGRADVAALAAELARLDTSVIGLFRYTAEDTTVDGVEIPAGAGIWAAFGATNRDPSAFADPDALDLRRAAERSPLTFGYGAHYCIGRLLAETQIRVALEATSRRYPSLSAAAPVFEAPSYLLRLTPVLMVAR